MIFVRYYPKQVVTNAASDSESFGERLRGGRRASRFCLSGSHVA